MTIKFTGFQDENAQVQLQLLTAVVKLFLKRPQDTQELVQHVLSLATQDSDNPDLRDRGFIYWRLLSTDPAAAKEVVLADKPLISEETDLLEPTLLDELICHISSLASVYHKPPTAFVEGRTAGIRKTLPNRQGSDEASGSSHGASSSSHNNNNNSNDHGTVIPSQDSLIGDLLSMDINAPAAPSTAAPITNSVDLLGGGLDILVRNIFLHFVVGWNLFCEGNLIDVVYDLFAARRWTFRGDHGECGRGSWWWFAERHLRLGWTRLDDPADAEDHLVARREGQGTGDPGNV